MSILIVSAVVVISSSSSIAVSKVLVFVPSLSFCFSPFPNATLHNTADLSATASMDL